MAISLLARSPKPFEPRPLALIEARLERPIPFSPLLLDALPPRPLGALPLQPLALEPLRNRPAAPERDHIAVAATEPLRRDLASRSSIGDLVVPGKPHPAWV